MLRIAAITTLVARTELSPPSAWHLATLAFIAPFILLAPLNGYLSNSLPRRRVLLGAAAFTTLVLLPFIFLPSLDGQWIWLLLLTAFASAIYQAARFAVLPAAAAESRITLPRVNGWMETGSSGAILGGILLGWYLVTTSTDNRQPELAGRFARSERAMFDAGRVCSVSLRSDSPRKATIGGVGVLPRRAPHWPRTRRAR